MRRLAPSFVVTASLAACAKTPAPLVAEDAAGAASVSAAPTPTPTPTINANPPPIPATVPTHTRNPPPTPMLDDYPKLLNGKDAQGRPILRSADEPPTCYVASGAAHTPVACPAAMTTDAWSACADGSLRMRKAGDGCACWTSGDALSAARGARRVPCP